MRIAACLNASPDEIIFTPGGSEADNQAILSAARAGAQAGKRHIISTAIEHHAVLHTLEKLEREGYEVELLDVRSNGAISAEQVERAIREDTCLVTVMYANNEIGSIQPVSEIDAVCRGKGVTFHTDAVQAAALEEACAHMAENTKKVSALRNRLITGLSQIPDAVLNGDPENRLPGNVNFSF